MKLKNMTILILCVSLIGCRMDTRKTMTQQNAESMAEGIRDTASLSIAATLYYSKYAKWPDSIERLKAFCSSGEKEQQCPDLDWSRYTNTKLKQAQDGNLMIEFYSPKESDIKGKDKLKVTVTLPKPDTVVK